jgi:phospholipid/cholesterol/gamma-HCH transport system substrate-binding protein
MNKSNFELKVGIFVFIGLIILSIVVFSIGDIHIFETGYTVKLTFGFANGVEVAAPVRLAGVRVGEVKALEVVFDEELGKTRVELLAWIQKGTRIPKDSYAHINNLGLLGEKYVEITPGKDYVQVLCAGDVLVGTDPISMEKVTELGYKVAIKLDQTVEAINRIVSDEEIKLSLKRSLENTELFTQDLKALTESANAILDKVKSGEGTVGRLLSDDSLYNSLESLVEDLKRHPWKLFYRPKEKMK